MVVPDQGIGGGDGLSRTAGLCSIGLPGQRVT